MASPSPEVIRTLAAILMADVVDYGRMMGMDEAQTVRLLQANRQVFRRQIGARRGRVLDAKGDAIMAAFPSAVDAVAAAAAIQQELAAENEALPAERQMQFRIGINLGDVIEEDDTLYGDGVNVAARLETLAEPGGICIARSVHDQVLGKLPLEFAYLGEHQVKTQTVRAYKVVVGASATRPGCGVANGASAIQPAAASEPSLAVLPFVNMSGELEQDHFADGLTDILITDLSKLRNLHVAARNAVFGYKGLANDIRDVGRTLNVSHVLEGGIQKSGTRIRLNTQLIDTATGDHVWADRYDREITDVFQVQDEISHAIVTELNVKLVEGEYARIYANPTLNEKARELVLEGLYVFRRFNRYDSARALQLTKLALELDPDNAPAWCLLGWIHAHQGSAGWVATPEDSIQKALDAAGKALDIAPDFSLPYSLRGHAHIHAGRDYEEGMGYLRRAVELNPNDSTSLANFGWFRAYQAGGAQEALESARKAMQLNPVPPDWMYGGLGAALRACAELSESLAVLEECARRLPDFIFCRFDLLFTLMEMGKTAEAQEQAGEVLRIYPGFTIPKNGMIRGLAADFERQRYIGYLRAAGLPEGTPQAM